MNFLLKIPVQVIDVVRDRSMLGPAQFARSGIILVGTTEETKAHSW